MSDLAPSAFRRILSMIAEGFVVDSVNLLVCGRLVGMEDKFEQVLAVYLLANFPKRG